MNRGGVQPGAAVHGLELGSRCIAAVSGDMDRNLFLVGTLSLQGGNNLVHLLEYHEDRNAIECAAIWSHRDEIWNIACCPSKLRKDYFFTVWNTSTSNTGVTLWSMEGGGAQELKELMSLPNLPTAAKVLWEPSGISDHVLVVGDSGVSIVSLDGSCTQADVATTIPLPTGMTHRVTGGAWDPNHPDVCAVAVDAHVVQCDIRQRQCTPLVEYAHQQCVRDLQYNSNKMYHIATGGDDGIMRVWDVRCVRESGTSPVPLFALEAHDHWVSTVAFNPFHDQLIITSSADSTVKLWNCVEVSSNARQEVIPSHIPRKVSQHLLKVFNEYEDSVYSAAWSSCSPSWVFATVSFTGKVLVHQVPSEVKYDILLHSAHDEED